MGEVLQLWQVPEHVRRKIWRACGYGPSEEQLLAHLDDHRVKEVAGGERAGKSYWTANEMHVWITVRPDLYWIVGPTYELARPEFQHLIDIGLKSGVIDPDSISMPKNGSCQLRTRLGNGIVVTKSSTDPIGLAGVAPAGVSMVEAAQSSYETFLRLRGRVAQKRGPLVLSGTFEGAQSWYADTWRLWQSANVDGARSFSLPTWSNLAVFPGGRNDPEIKALEATYPEDVFNERFGAIPCVPQGLVFREFNHLVHVTEEAAFNSSYPVQLWVDPGYAHAYAVLAVQITPYGIVHQIDEVYEVGHTANEIISECMTRPWWSKVTHLVMDVAGKAHPGAESQSEIWRNRTGFRAIMQRVPIVDGILRHRTFLKDPETGQPRLFHHPRCKGTIGEYGRYRYRKDADNRTATELPLDRENDAMKALAYGLVCNFGHVAKPLHPTHVEVRF